MDGPKSSPRPPFNDVDADIILRSADNVEFWLYKVIIAKSSSVFRGMLTLPDAHAHNKPQVVSVSEDADTLENLLRFCYPVQRPAFHTVDQLGTVLTAARKYDMPSVLEDLLRCAEPFLHSSPPLRVYLIAYKCELPGLARQAARALLDDPHSLDPDPMPPSSVLSPVRSCMPSRPTGGTYSNKGNPHLFSTWAWLNCDESCVEDKTQGIWAGRKSGGRTLYPCLWWARYRTHVREAVMRCPTSKAVVDSRAIELAVQRAASCDSCAPKAQTHMTEFSLALKRRIDKAVDMIKITLPFYVDADAGIDFGE
ncbi:hypothetical protein C8Q74DRAFT_1367341 [Fomes fomentarius]|nr:hypothetical protein C8Q74DRAFT_1367341 [Fomes fomentarius]